MKIGEKNTQLSVSSPFAWAPSFKESYQPRIKQNVSPETKAKSRRLRETNAASELRTDSTSKPGMEGGRNRDRTERVSMPSVAKEQRDRASQEKQPDRASREKDGVDRTIHPEDKKPEKDQEA